MKNTRRIIAALAAVGTMARFSIPTAARVMRVFFSTLFPSVMPGTTLWARMCTAFISAKTSDASARQLFMRPGFLFCGIPGDSNWKVPMV